MGKTNSPLSKLSHYLNSNIDTWAGSKVIKTVRQGLARLQTQNFHAQFVNPRAQVVNLWEGIVNCGHLLQIRAYNFYTVCPDL